MAVDSGTQEADSYLVRMQIQVGKRLHTDASCLTTTTLGGPISVKSRSGPIFLAPKARFAGRRGSRRQQLNSLDEGSQDSNGRKVERATHHTGGGDLETS